jgi:hypothetical protein
MSASRPLPWCAVAAAVCIRICCLCWLQCRRCGGSLGNPSQCCLLLSSLQALLDTVEEMGGTFMLTADHGNAEDMVQVGAGWASHNSCPRLATNVPAPLPAPLPAAAAHCLSMSYMCVLQREKKSGAPVVKDGKPVELTSHTLNPVPCAIGGPGLPPGLHFRWGVWWEVAGGFLWRVGAPGAGPAGSSA